MYSKFAAALFPALLAALSLTSVRSLCASDIYSTASHPFSSALTVDVYLGDPNGPSSAFVTSIGPAGINGTVDAEVVLDGSGDGTIEVFSTSLVMGDVAGTIDFGTFGTIDYSLLGLRFDVTTPTSPVNANQFSIPFDEDVVLAIDSGDLLLFNPTGLIADLEGDEFPISRNFDFNPLIANLDFVSGSPTFDGLTDLGPGLAVDAAEIQLDVPSVATIILDLPNPPLEFWVDIHGEINVAVPEPSSVSLVLIGVFVLGVGAAKRCQFRSNANSRANAAPAKHAAL